MIESTQCNGERIVEMELQKGQAIKSTTMGWTLIDQVFITLVHSSEANLQGNEWLKEIIDCLIRFKMDV